MMYQEPSDLPREYNVDELHLAGKQAQHKLNVLVNALEQAMGPNGGYSDNMPKRVEVACDAIARRARELRRAINQLVVATIE